MGKSALADFVGTFNAEVGDWDDHQEGRVLLGTNQLVLARSKDDTVSIPLSSIFDVNIGATPRIFDPFPGTTLTIAHDSDRGRVVAAVSGEESTIEKFHSVLFKAVLNGERVIVKHPARRGGRVTGAGYRPGSLSLAGGGVQFDLGDETVHIEPAAVTAFSREKRAVEGTERPVFVVRHMQDGTALTTHAATDSARTLSLLGRYLRRHYDELIASLEGISLRERDVETLVTIYSTQGMDVTLSSVVDASPREMNGLLQSLASNGLVRPGDDGPELTTKGQVVVNHYMDRVNQ